MSPSSWFYATPRISRHLPVVVAAVTAFLLATTAQAQVSQFEPRVGQEGKDVVWVPTPQTLVERMLDIADVKPGEFLIDLGSGDGRTVITAAGRGLRAHGIEYNADMVQLAKQAAREAGLVEKATFAQGDLFEADLSQADVITLFLLPSINEKLSPTLLELEPGTRIVSNSFRMGDWESDDSSTVDEDCSRWCTALLWYVPAKVGGDWILDGQPLQFQ
ncbi:MAG: cyclopropane-fatty-acyl-phospholipid synthase family protein, partial [Pigmentiphaga sp.]